MEQPPNENRYRNVPKSVRREWRPRVTTGHHRRTTRSPPTGARSRRRGCGEGKGRDEGWPRCCRGWMAPRLSSLSRPAERWARGRELQLGTPCPRRLTHEQHGVLVRPIDVARTDARGPWGGHRGFNGGVACFLRQRVVRIGWQRR
jgi:hypothetical protein